MQKCSQMIPLFNVSSETSIHNGLYINNEKVLLVLIRKLVGENVKRIKIRRRYSESNTTKPKSESIQGEEAIWNNDTREASHGLNFSEKYCKY